MISGDGGQMILEGGDGGQQDVLIEGADGGQEDALPADDDAGVSGVATGGPAESEDDRMGEL